MSGTGTPMAGGGGMQPFIEAGKQGIDIGLGITDRIQRRKERKQKGKQFNRQMQFTEEDALRNYLLKMREMLMMEDQYGREKQKQQGLAKGLFGGI